MHIYIVILMLRRIIVKQGCDNTVTNTPNVLLAYPLPNSTVTALLHSAKRCNGTEIYPTRWVGNSVIHVQLAVCLYNYM